MADIGNISGKSINVAQLQAQLKAQGASDFQLNQIKQLDTSGDGIISADELKSGLINAVKSNNANFLGRSLQDFEKEFGLQGGSESFLNTNNDLLNLFVDTETNKILTGASNLVSASAVTVTVSNASTIDPNQAAMDFYKGNKDLMMTMFGSAGNNDFTIQGDHGFQWMKDNFFAPGVAAGLTPDQIGDKVKQFNADFKAGKNPNPADYIPKAVQAAVQPAENHTYNMNTFNNMNAGGQTSGPANIKGQLSENSSVDDYKRVADSIRGTDPDRAQVLDQIAQLPNGALKTHLMQSVEDDVNTEYDINEAIKTVDKSGPDAQKQLDLIASAAKLGSAKNVQIPKAEQHWDVLNDTGISGPVRQQLIYGLDGVNNNIDYANALTLAQNQKDLEGIAYVMRKNGDTDGAAAVEALAKTTNDSVRKNCAMALAITYNPAVAGNNNSNNNAKATGYLSTSISAAGQDDAQAFAAMALVAAKIGDNRAESLRIISNPDVQGNVRDQLRHSIEDDWFTTSDIEQAKAFAISSGSQADKDAVLAVAKQRVPEAERKQNGLETF